MRSIPLAILLAVLPLAPALAQSSTAYAEFEGKALIAVHDGDMLATAYVDGQLGPRESRDALSITTFSSDLTRLNTTILEVSNSVAGPPTAVATTPDGRLALVVESFGPRSEAMQRFTELPVGSKLTLVDISDSAAPRTLQTIDIGKRPEGLSVSPSGDMVAVTLHPADGRGVAFVPLANGRLGTPSYAAMPGTMPQQRLSHVEWHPSGNFIAVTQVDQAIVRFARVIRGQEGVTLQEWGNPVITSKYPFMGRFTPDGRYFLTGNLYWGPDVPGFWTEAPFGDVTSIRFAAEPTAGANNTQAVRHFLAGRASTGVSPEGIAISPDGRWVVTTNLERSYLPQGDPRLTPYSSLTLLRFDSATGQLVTAGTYAYDGVLPEAATFDASGRFVAVVTYDQIDPARKGGSIDFWRLVEGDTPMLVKLRSSAVVPHGPHSMVLTR